MISFDLGLTLSCVNSWYLVMFANLFHSTLIMKTVNYRKLTY
jgi:hypothetical protein